jgi:hypothetical protein
MAHSFFKSKGKAIAVSWVVVGSTFTIFSFQNCAGSKTGSADQVSTAVSSQNDVSATDPSVTKNMNSGGTVGTIGGAGSIGQFKGSSALLPGFTISKDEIAANQLANTDSVNKNVVCKLFSRPVVQVGQTVSFMIVMYDSIGRENFDIYKDGSGNVFHFPVAGHSHIDLVGQNNSQSVISSVREKASLESHRLGHAVFVVNDPAKVGTYSRAAEIFNENGQLICRTNKVDVKIVATEIPKPVSTGCLATDVATTVDLKDKKLCEGFHILGLDPNGIANKVSVTDALGSKESNAQGLSRLQGAQFCASGRALVSSLKDAGAGSELVENECLK